MELAILAALLHQPATLISRLRRYPMITSMYLRDIMSASSLTSPLSNRRTGVRASFAGVDTKKRDVWSGCLAALISSAIGLLDVPGE